MFPTKLNAEGPYGIFYLAALLVTLIFVAISVATDKCANEVDNDEGNDGGNNSALPLKFFAGESHRLNNG